MRTTYDAAAHGLSVTLAALGSLALAVGLALLLGRNAATASASRQLREQARPPARLS